MALTTTELFRVLDWFYQATAYTGRPSLVARLPLAQCSQPIPVVRFFTTLHSFTKATNDLGIYTNNSDGYETSAGLVISGNFVYGTAQFGGSWGAGTVFAVNTH